jgi:hypothetical protein
VIAHVMGLPFEESVLQLAPAGAAVMSGVAVVGWTWLTRMRGRLRHGPTKRRKAEI